MDRNLAGETSFCFSPTLTETASTELLKIQGSIDQLKTELYHELYQQNDHIVKLENMVTSEMDTLDQKINTNKVIASREIASLKQDIQVIGWVLFCMLMLLPVRIFNWFKCFAEVTVCESTVEYEETVAHAVLIVLRPLNASPNVDKKTIRALNKLSYKSLARIKKAEKKPNFKIILSAF